MHVTNTSVKQKLFLAALNGTGQESIKITLAEYTYALCKTVPLTLEGNTKELEHSRLIPIQLCAFKQYSYHGLDLF